MMDLYTKSMTELAAGLESGDFTSVELTESLLERIAAHDDKPLLYISFGSLGSGDTELLKRIIGVVADLPYRALVNVGDYADDYEARRSGHPMRRHPWPCGATSPSSSPPSTNASESARSVRPRGRCFCGEPRSR